MHREIESRVREAFKHINVLEVSILVCIARSRYANVVIGSQDHIGIIWLLASSRVARLAKEVYLF